MVSLVPGHLQRGGYSQGWVLRGEYVQGCILRGRVLKGVSPRGNAYSVGVSTQGLGIRGESV